MQAVLASGGKYHYDAGSQSFYVVKGNQWISVEKPGLPPAVAHAGDPPVGSLVRKARFIKQQGLAGAMFWEVRPARPHGRPQVLYCIPLPYALPC